MKVSWSSPSNIALIKYWGKFGNQYPKNPSISFTLNNSVTKTSIERFESESFYLDFLFEGEKNEKFELKINKYLILISADFPWILKSKLRISSTNTFPHSSGIASSASSMSALVLCILSLDELITNKQHTEEDFFRLASKYSRLASGSACRSLYGGMVIWGEHPLIGNNDYGVGYQAADNIFSSYCDSIIIVDSREKSVSSRAGHSLMDQHPFKDERYKVANRNFEDLLDALAKKDLEDFIRIVENEALMLHSLMMTSTPSYILLRPDSLLVIEKIKIFRSKTKIPLCFTIDAGPNIHILYPFKYKDDVQNFIKEELSNYKVINDEVGLGPKKYE